MSTKASRAAEAARLEAERREAEYHRVLLVFPLLGIIEVEIEASAERSDDGDRERDHPITRADA